MSGTSSITRQHISFAIAGIVFGALLGFVGAHQLYGGRFSGSGGAPETMGGQRGAPTMASSPAGPEGGGGGASGPGPAPGGGDQMAQMEQVKKELAALKQAIEKDPHDVSALGRLGNLYMDAGMYDKAAEYYRDALEVEPGNPDLRTDLGTCLRGMGRVSDALREFQESVSRDPKHWKGWFNIGIVYLYDLDQYQKAEEAFGRALALNPGSFDMNAVRAEIEKVRAAKAGRPAGSTPS